MVKPTEEFLNVATTTIENMASKNTEENKNVKQAIQNDAKPVVENLDLDMCLGYVELLKHIPNYPLDEITEFEQMVKKLGVFYTNSPEYNLCLEQIRIKYTHLHTLAENPNLNFYKKKAEPEDMWFLISVLRAYPDKIEVVVEMIWYFLSSNGLLDMDERILDYAKYLRTTEFQSSGEENIIAHFGSISSLEQKPLYPGSKLTNHDFSMFLFQLAEK